ncbi:hypothetical protein EDB80DRAFT_674788 [Ilyonectria destructans]|nr:hypothetical protein EDB80DRAFT_674788 [Ilyonectria destructans]
MEHVGITGGHGRVGTEGGRSWLGREWHGVSDGRIPAGRGIAREQGRVVKTGQAFVGWGDDWGMGTDVPGCSWISWMGRTNSAVGLSLVEASRAAKHLSAALSAQSPSGECGLSTSAGPALSLSWSPGRMPPAATSTPHLVAACARYMRGRTLHGDPLPFLHGMTIRGTALGPGGGAGPDVVMASALGRWTTSNTLPVCHSVGTKRSNPSIPLLHHEGCTAPLRKQTPPARALGPVFLRRTAPGACVRGGNDGSACNPAGTRSQLEGFRRGAMTERRPADDVDGRARRAAWVKVAPKGESHAVAPSRD